MFILACDEVKQMCYDIKPILVVIQYIILILQWSVPIILLLWGSVDLFRAIARADDPKIANEAKDVFIKRLIYGAVIFLVPFVVRLVLGVVENNMLKDNDEFSPTSWVECWNNVEKDDYFSECEDIFKKKESTHNQDYTELTGENEIQSDNHLCYVYVDKNVENVSNCPSGSRFTGVDNNQFVCDFNVTYDSNNGSQLSIYQWLIYYNYGNGIGSTAHNFYTDGENWLQMKEEKENVCKEIINDAYREGSYSKCIDCGNQNIEAGFICEFNYGKVPKLVSNTRPNMTYDGQYTIYSCPSNIPCSDEQVMEDWCSK